VARYGDIFPRIIARLKGRPGNAGLAEEQAEEPGPDPFEGGFRFRGDDLAYLLKVARRLALLATQPGLAPEEARSIGRVAAALEKLPELTPEIDVQIEIAHRMGDAEYNESYSYAVQLDQGRIAIRSSGSRFDQAAGSDSFGLESLEWRSDGQTAREGNRDTWLERLEYALARDYTVNVKDESGRQT
jgi:hypothetical protein